MDDNPTGAILQRDEKTYAIVPRTPVGLVTPEHLENIAAVARKVGMDLPAKVKIGVSGCPFCCGESFVRDIGVFGNKKGWNLVVGGSSARRPRIGDLIQEKIPEDEVIPLVKQTLEYYRDNAKKRERMARFVDRIGIEEVKEALC